MNIKTKIANEISKTITDSWISEDSSSWYRVWSDGWIEQGGNIPSVKSNTYYAATINLPIPFSNTNYIAVLTQYDAGKTLGIDSANNGQSVHTKTTTSMGIAAYAWTYGRDWYACGY